MMGDFPARLVVVSRLPKFAKLRFVVEAEDQAGLVYS